MRISFDVYKNFYYQTSSSSVIMMASSLSSQQNCHQNKMRRIAFGCNERATIFIKIFL